MEPTPEQTAFMAKNWRDLIKPRGLVVDQESLTNTYGKFTVEPFERGFGTTVGNSLRRILLRGRADDRVRRHLLVNARWHPLHPLHIVIPVAP